MDSLRLFGDLPLLVDDKYKTGVIAVTCAVLGIVVLHWISMIVQLARHWTKIRDYGQQVNSMLIFFTHVGLIFGLADVIGSTNAYPFRQPLWCQISGFACFACIALLFIVSTIFGTDFRDRKIEVNDETFGYSKLLIALGVLLLVAHVIPELGIIIEYARSTPHNIPSGWLISLFTVKIASCGILLIGGLYALSKMYMEPKEGPRMAFIPRVTLLVFAVALAVCYAVFTDLESPYPLTMRLLQTLSIFGVLLVAIAYILSVIKSISLFADRDQLLAEGVVSSKGRASYVHVE